MKLLAEGNKELGMKTKSRVFFFLSLIANLCMTTPTKNFGLALFSVFHVSGWYLESNATTMIKPRHLEQL